MNNPSKQPSDLVPKVPNWSALPLEKNQACGTFLLRKGVSSMNDIQRAGFFRTMKASGLSPFI